MIHLIPLGFVKKWDLQQVKSVIESRFHTPVTITYSEIDPKAFHDDKRSQYYSSAILKYFSENMPEKASKVLVVTAYDLFIPILTYVFGESQLNGPCAIVSSFRLDNTLYGLPQNTELFVKRLSKEAVHELGHAYGLIHCRNLTCVMKSSTYVEEMDQKSDEFCDRCAAIINEKSKDRKK